MQTEISLATSATTACYPLFISVSTCYLQTANKWLYRPARQTGDCCFSGLLCEQNMACCYESLGLDGYNPVHATL